MFNVIIIPEIDPIYLAETSIIDDNDEDADNYVTDGRSCVDMKYNLLIYLLLYECF